MGARANTCPRATLCIRIQLLGLPPQLPIEAVCGSDARTDLAGGRWATIDPTGTGPIDATHSIAKSIVMVSAPRASMKMRAIRRWRSVEETVKIFLCACATLADARAKGNPKRTLMLGGNH